MSSFADLMGPAAAQAQPPKTPEEHSQLEGGWKQYLQNPAIQAALLQFSIQMMQPRVPGQSTIGQIGQAVGKGGEAAGRTIQNQETQQARQDKLDLERRDAASREKQVEVQGRQADATMAGVQAQRDATAAHTKESAAEIASRELISKNGIAAQMAQIQAQLTSNERVTDRQLLANLISAESQRYSAEEKAYEEGKLMDPTLKPPTPPTQASILSQYQVYSGALSNKGRLPPGNSILTVPDVLAKLNNPDPNEQAKGRAALQFMDPTDIQKVMQGTQNPVAPAQAPGPSRSAPPLIAAPQGGTPPLIAKPQAPVQAPIAPPIPQSPVQAPAASSPTPAIVDEPKKPYSSVTDAEKNAIIEEILQSQRNVKKVEDLVSLVASKFTGIYQKQRADIAARAQAALSARKGK